MMVMFFFLLCAPSQHVGSRRATARQPALSRSTAACTGERGGGEELGRGACRSPSHGSPLTLRARSTHVDSTAFSGLFAATAFWKRRLRLPFCPLLRLEYSSQGSLSWSAASAPLAVWSVRRVLRPRDPRGSGSCGKLPFAPARQLPAHGTLYRTKRSSLVASPDELHATPWS